MPEVDGQPAINFDFCFHSLVLGHPVPCGLCGPPRQADGSLGEARANSLLRGFAFRRGSASKTSSAHPGVLPLLSGSAEGVVLLVHRYLFRRGKNFATHHGRDPERSTTQREPVHQVPPRASMQGGSGQPRDSAHQREVRSRGQRSEASPAHPGSPEPSLPSDAVIGSDRQSTRNGSA